jgi:hypothetical protein
VSFAAITLFVASRVFIVVVVVVYFVKTESGKFWVHTRIMWERIEQMWLSPQKRRRGSYRGFVTWGRVPFLCNG